jgi:hypothetical protein
VLPPARWHSMPLAKFSSALSYRAKEVFERAWFQISPDTVWLCIPLSRSGLPSPALCTKTHCHGYYRDSNRLSTSDKQRVTE